MTIIIRSVLRVSGCQQQQVSGWHVIWSKHYAGKLHGHLANLYLRLNRNRMITKFSFIYFFILNHHCYKGLLTFVMYAATRASMRFSCAPCKLA